MLTHANKFRVLFGVLAAGSTALTGCGPSPSETDSVVTQATTNYVAESDEVAQPSVTSSEVAYTPDELRGVRITSLNAEDTNGQCIVNVEVSNQSDHNLSARSSIGKPLILAWRFTDAPAGWHQDNRKDLPADLPSRGAVNVAIPVGPVASARGRTLEVTVGQEGAFWLHDHGFTPVRIFLQPTN
jgi:hypothetical protein